MLSTVELGMYLKQEPVLEEANLRSTGTRSVQVTPTKEAGRMLTVLSMCSACPLISSPVEHKRSGLFQIPPRLCYSKRENGILSHFLAQEMGLCAQLRRFWLFVFLFMM